MESYRQFYLRYIRKVKMGPEPFACAHVGVQISEKKTEILDPPQRLMKQDLLTRRLILGFVHKKACVSERDAQRAAARETFIRILSCESL